MHFYSVPRPTWLSVLAPMTTLLFLFSGLYKGLFFSPIDLTAATAVLTMCTVAFFLRKDDFQKPVLLLFGVLTIYLSFRLIPGFSSWGVHKIVEMTVFGLPAILAGITMAREKAQFRIFIGLLAWGGLPASIVVILHSITHDPFMFSAIGSGGYQLTGIFLALSAIASVVTKHPVLFAVTVLGLLVCGHVSGSLFVIFSLVVVFAVERDWMTMAKCCVGALVLIALYTHFISPPLSVMRIAWKLGGAIVVSLETNKTNEVGPGKPSGQMNSDAGAQSGTSSQAPRTVEHSIFDPNKVAEHRVEVVEALKNSGVIGKLIVEHAASAPSQTPNFEVAGDRVQIYREAVSSIERCKLWGCGYGAIEYAGDKSSHNVLLELAAEGGVIAFILGGAILIISGWAAVMSRQAFVLGCFVIIVLTYLVSGNWGARLLLFVCGLAVGSAEIRTVTRSTENDRQASAEA